jgi:hypothetical protein
MPTVNRKVDSLGQTGSASPLGSLLGGRLRFGILTSETSRLSERIETVNNMFTVVVLALDCFHN